MKLYMVPLAPNPTKVMLYIAEREELGVQMSIEQIVVNTVKGRHKEPEHLARNPFGTVPALELDDGTYLVRVMIDFLEDKFPDKGCTGAAQKKGKARDLERVIDLRLGGPMGAFGHATNSPLGRPPGRKSRPVSGIDANAAGHLENLLGDGRELLCGNHVNVATHPAVVSAVHPLR